MTKASCKFQTNKYTISQCSNDQCSWLFYYTLYFGGDFLLFMVEIWYHGVTVHLFPVPYLVSTHRDKSGLELLFFVSLSIFFFFGHMAHEILVPWPGIKLESPELKARVVITRSPRESLVYLYLIKKWDPDDNAN